MKSEISMNNETKNPANYILEQDGSYRIENYDIAPAFSSFLPGIAGAEGIPLWCMYVNRAQAVVSFGLANKDNAIGEFLSATWAYQLVGIQSFRTFCKVNDDYYEPFQNNVNTANYSYSRNMTIKLYKLAIEEINDTVGLSFDVEYFSPVNMPVGSLVRTVKIKNISGKTKNIEILDGLGVILPTGLNDTDVKTMRHLNEAYCCVKLHNNYVPYYSAKVLAHDEAEVTKVTRGSFFASWISEENSLFPITPLVDPGVIFGKDNDLITPTKFISGQTNADDQVFENRLPCAFTPARVKLTPDETLTLKTVIGVAPNTDQLDRFLNRFVCENDFEEASQQSRQLINSITTPAFTLSDEPLLDAYSKQSYLDNVLRGGIPLILPCKEGSQPLHIYSRRHGDLERDYNYFELPPHPLSSGPGNYRDICQNRRYDIWFYPELFDQEIKMFVNLLQADGYNPLGVQGYKWALDDNVDPLSICPVDNKDAQDEFCQILSNEFHPGMLLSWINAFEINISDHFEWLCSVLKNCKCELAASGCEGGYWIDHWIYIADMLEAFIGIYPDKIQQLLTGKEDITWFNEGAYVQPRKEKYHMRDSGPLQLNSLIETGKVGPNLPATTLLGKLCALLAVKAVTFDYEGKAIEMEAGRPSWNDSLNGLPGLFGSSTCEAAATARLTDWLLDNIKEFPDTAFPDVVANLITEVIDDLNRDKYDWARAADIRENYRKSLLENKSEEKTFIDGSKLQELLKGISKRAHNAIEMSKDEKTGLLNTYYQNVPEDVKVADREDDHCEITKFSAKPLPCFIEGQVHWLRLIKDKKKAKQIYDNVKASPLYDQQLKMYKLNECLDEWPHDIGRARTFTRGWFENESVWTHMSYKFILELLKAGLYDEFFEDVKTMLTPFMDPKVYGRSVLENSSFIASSACPNPDARGRGFVARLSGSTAEFIHMWLLMTAGAKPFTVDDNTLQFSLAPVLPGDWFTSQPKNILWNNEQIIIPEKSFACAFLGDILLVYKNSQRSDTFGKKAVKPVKYVLDGKVFQGSCVKGEYAQLIRAHKIKRIDVELA